MAAQVWGVHMDRSVGLTPIEQSFIGIGWTALGNLQQVGTEREAFKSAVRRVSPGSKEGSIRVQAGVLYRFVHEMKDGDFVIYPSKTDRMVNVGVVAGPYYNDASALPDYPNRRPVKWIAHLPREDFSQAALYEIGSFITLFSVRNNAAEFVATATGQPSEVLAWPPDTDHGDEGSIAKAVSSQAEETTQDFVIRRLKTGISAYQLEEFVAHLLECMGYNACHCQIRRRRC